MGSNQSANNNSDTEPREIIIGSSDYNETAGKSNYVRTTKYTAITFLPVSLYLQFSRYANIYFLVVAILQSISAISPLNPVSAIAPLIFVISLSMIREAFEDLARYKSDLETNSTRSRRYRDGKWHDVEWKDVCVGDIVKVNDLEFFPADIILLSSADSTGTAYIMTSSLDGEKNLKPKFAPKDTQKLAGNGQDFVLMGTLKYNPPDENLYSFGGSLALGEQPIGLSAKQLLLRGAMLKNTDWIVGVVVYTGSDTKLMKNSGTAAYKQSNIENITNRMILIIIGIELILCLIVFIGACVWNGNNAEKYNEFIPVRYSSFGEGALTFFTAFVLLNTMIPISLIISLEMIKLMQAYFINRDEDMMDPVEGRFSKAFTSSLNEELGQIEYIFSDKTGTLTSNTLEFKYSLIGDTFFGDKEFIEEKKALKRQPTYVNRTEGISFSFDSRDLIAVLKGNAANKGENFIFTSSSGQELYRLKSLQQISEHFMLTLSVCHDCMVEINKENPNQINYQGMSPDEVSLVDAAHRLGYTFLRSTNFGKVISIGGVEQNIEVLEFFEFDSERKRSSIIIKHDGVIKFLMKGADSIIIQRLSTKTPQPYLKKTNALLEKFSLKGLRTLCYSMKVLSNEEYEEIRRKLASYDNSPDKAKLVADFASVIENEFTLLGCTAVEDKLQDRVPQTIADFITANIKVWMLTGDKLETAENIAYSCQLIQKDFQKVYLREQEDLDRRLLEISREIEMHHDNGKKVSLIVEGPIVSKITENKVLAPRYVEDIFSRCDSVVCCRMSPNGKGDIVSLVKDYKKRITLAVGDGANDVNMIKRAHIGVGLYGKEGMRAVQASDYGLVEFKSLWKLLFVHGRWSYIRISEMIQYFFYKNIVFAFPQFVYCCFNAFSGQTIFDDYYITFYNLVFTSWPVIIRAVFDQDIYYKKWTRKDRENMFDRKLLYENKLLKQFYPHLYYVGQQNVIFSYGNFALWVLNGAATGVIIFLFTKFSLGSMILNSDGYNVDIWFVSIIVYTAIIFVVDIKLLMFTKSFNWLSFISILFFSIGLYIIYFFIADQVSAFKVYKTVIALLMSPHFYLIVLLAITISVIFDVFYIMLVREIKTPIYLLFNSLAKNRKFNQDERAIMYATIVDKIKRDIYSF